MEPTNIVIVGKTGDGKSSAGNTILGTKDPVFATKASASSETAACQRQENEVYGRKISVIDTPGVFDTNHDNMETKSVIIKYLIECAPAVHAFVVVIKVGRYTIQEDEVMQQVLSMLNEENVMKHTVILFTYGDELEDQTIEEFIKDCSKLQELVDKCGGRCHVIDNKRWNDCPSGYKSNRAQVKNLLETIDQMVKENGCYTNEVLQILEEEIQEEMKNDNSLPTEEKRKRAKENVFRKILPHLAGVTTGALVGALLGAGVALASVAVVLKQFLTAKGMLTKRAKRTESGVTESGVEAVVAGVVMSAAAGAGVASALVGENSVIVLRAGIESAGAAADTGVDSGSAIAAYVLAAAAVAGGVGGAVTGWKAAADADSVCDAMNKAATANYENAKSMIHKLESALSLDEEKK